MSFDLKREEKIKRINFWRHAHTYQTTYVLNMRSWSCCYCCAKPIIVHEYLNNIESENLSVILSRRVLYVKEQQIWFHRFYCVSIHFIFTHYRLFAHISKTSLTRLLAPPTEEASYHVVLINTFILQYIDVQLFFYGKARKKWVKVFCLCMHIQV